MDRTLLKLVLGLCWVGAVAAQSVTSISVETISHSSAAIDFVATGVANASQIRYIATASGSCTGGTGGYTQSNSQSAVSTTFNRLSIFGLAPSTQYQACAEISANGGSTWIAGPGVTFTTLALPAVHPALPIAPMDFNTDYPNTSSYVVYTVASNCSDFSTAYSAAIARWATQGTVIQIPPGTDCGSQGPFLFTNVPPDVFTFAPSAVSTSTNEINIPSHGFAEGDLVSFGRTFRSSTTYPASTSCDVGYGTIAPGGIQSGQRYTVHVVDANNFQIYCLGTTNVMAFTTQGSSSTGGFYALPWTSVNGEWQRRLAYFIVIRSSATDAQLPPEHADITPLWASQMGVFTDPITNVADTTGNSASCFLCFGSSDNDYEIPFGNVRIGPGIEIKTADYQGTIHSSDPWFFTNIIQTYTWDGGITFDRIWFHGPGAPNRLQGDRYINGSNIGILNSYWDNLVYFHANNTGLAVAKTGSTTATIASGTVNPGTGPILVSSTITITISGSGTGRAYAYLDLTNSDALTVSVPTGVTASCSPACLSATAGTNSGTCNEADGWPKTARGEVTVGQIACIDVASGVISDIDAADPIISAWNPEGDSGILGIGPGPLKFEGNHTEGAGIPWHFDDSGGAAFRGNDIIRRNYIESNPKWLTGSSVSDGLRAMHRQPIEWKGGQYILITGNIFDYSWLEDNPTAPFITLTPLWSSNGTGRITDVNIQYNTFRHGAAVMEGIYGTCNEGPGGCAVPGLRYAFQNNLAFDLNGYTYSAYNPDEEDEPGFGYYLDLNGIEDLSFSSNTFYPQIGQFPFLSTFDYTPLEGYQGTNNFIWYTGVSAQIPSSFRFLNQAPLGCNALTDINYLNCALTQGPGTTSYNLSGNVMGGGWANSSVPSGQESGMSTAFSGLTNSYPATGTVAGTVSSLGWQNPTITAGSLYDFSLSNTSSWKAGNNIYTHAHDMGADMIALNAAQGLVTLTGAVQNTITTTGATIAYVAPDTNACSVDVSSSDPNVIISFTRFTDSGGIRPRATAITGLTTGTVYYYRVECPGNDQFQRTGSFKTH